MNFIRPLVYTLAAVLPQTAVAQTATGEQPSMGPTLLMFGGMFLLLYLLIIRPQSKRAKEHRQLVASIDKGDEVLTSGGLLGKVTRVSDDYIVVAVSDKSDKSGGVELKLLKSAVTAALPKGTIANV